MIWGILIVVAFFIGAVFMTFMTREIRRQRLKEQIRKRDMEEFYFQLLNNLHDEEEE